VFHVDVVKIYRDVAHVANGCARTLQASVPNVSSAFSDECCKCAYSDATYVSYICCKSMFEMFQLFQSCVTVSVFMLQVASVLFECCICFTNMLQVYVPNISSLHSSISCCKCFVFQRYVQRVMWVWTGRREKGRGETGPADGAHGAPGSCGRGVLALIPAPGSCLQGERGGVMGKERRARGRARRIGASYACVVGRGRRERTVAISGSASHFC
jgi:hypothetical protein